MLPSVKLLVILSIFFLIGGCIGGIVGFSLGVKTTIGYAVEVIPRYTNISIDAQAIKDALFQYRNRISGCEVPKL